MLSWANPTLASGIPECQLSEALKLGGAKAPLSFYHGTLEGVSYLIPKDRVGLIATHRQGIPLQTEVHRSIMIPDIGHVLEGKAERPQASSSPVALVPMPLGRPSSGWTCGTFSYTGDEQGRRQAETDRNPSKRPGSFVSSSHSVELRTAFRSTVIFAITKFSFKIIMVSPASTINSSTNTPKIAEQNSTGLWRPLVAREAHVPVPTGWFPAPSVLPLGCSKTHMSAQQLHCSLHTGVHCTLVDNMALLQFCPQLLTSIYSLPAASNPAGCFLLEVRVIAPLLLVL